jgi:hypothetical protein
MLGTRSASRNPLLLKGARLFVALFIVISALGGSALSALAEDAPPVETEQATDEHAHVHADGTIHDHSAGKDGADLAAQCASKGLEPVVDIYCTHGGDPVPEGFAIDRKVAPLSAQTLDAMSTAIACEGDGQSGPRVQVLYVRASDVSSSYTAYLSSFRGWVAGVDEIYNNSAAKTGGERHVRFVHSNAASCQVTIPQVVLSPTGDDTFQNTISELQAKGYNRTDRKYMIFMDAGVYCGIGNVFGDDQHGDNNANNGGPSYGRTDSGCWDSHTPAHELMHNLGGVQLSAPHTSGGYHCIDESDVMCYSDEPDYPDMEYLCNDWEDENLLDCNNDDYYHTNPTGGSYLATHWNAADSAFLVGGGSVPTCTDGFEPDNSAAQARSVGLGAVTSHVFCTGGDQDWIKVALTAGTTYQLETLNLSAAADTQLFLYDRDGTTELANNDDRNHPDDISSRIQFVPTASGTYYAKAIQFDGSASVSHTYDLKVAVAPANDAPEVKAPQSELVASTLDYNKARIKLTWTGTDSDGIARFDLEESVDGAAFKAVTLKNPTATKLQRSVKLGSTYAWRVRATDTLGAVSAWAEGGSVRADGVQETAASYTGTWKNPWLSGSYGGKVKFSNTGRDYAEFTFDGTGIALVSTRDYNRGKAEIWIDGAKVRTVDLYDWWTTTKQLVFVKNGLEAGTHTLMIRVTGTKNSWSDGTRVDIDGFVVLKQ